MHIQNLARVNMLLKFKNSTEAIHISEPANAQ
jgi:hypothetical protein